MDRLTETYFDEFGIKHAKLKDNIGKKTHRSYTWTPQEIANEKLAELEDFMEKHKCHSVGDLMLEFTISSVDKLNLKLTEEKLADLEAKLAESEEQIKMLEEHKFYANNIIQAYADKCKKANQNKISFCIEKLKSIKNELSNLIALRTNETFLIDGKKFRDYINNEIEVTNKENKNV